MIGPAATPTPVDLALIDGARDQLARARGILELGEVRAVAKGLEEYLRRREGAAAASRDAAVIRLRAERRIGQLLAADPAVKRGGSKSRRGTLKNLGVDRRDSHRWQRVAEIPDARFEKALARPEPTTAAVLAEWRAWRSETNAAGGGTGIEACTVADLRELIAQGRTFGTIYADPPWDYGNRASRGAAGDHYPTMPAGEISGLPVRELAARAAHCHLWTTTSFLPEGLDILGEWGFQYRSQFIWTKRGLGTGNYWRVSHEILLLGVRGAAPFADRTLRSWAEYARRGHSRKPAEMRRDIERASPAPRLELFAREVADGWSAWGNEVPRDLLLGGTR